MIVEHRTPSSPKGLSGMPGPFGMSLRGEQCTPQNARRILANLGKDIDIVAGVFDEAFLRSRKCDALEISREPLRCALSASHPLADRPRLSLADLSLQNLMLMQRGWNGDVDRLRDEPWEKHPEIAIEDFAVYNIEVFNRCEASDKLLMTRDPWADVHPLLLTKEVEWECEVSYGILHSSHPSVHVQALLDAVAQELDLT